MWMIVLICVVVLLLFVLRFNKGLFQRFKTVETVDGIIEAHTTALENAQIALDKSRGHLNVLQGRINQSVADIKVLKARAQRAVDENKDDEARAFIKRMKLEEQTLSEHQKNFDDASKNHQWYVDSVERERQAIIEAKQTAEGLTTKLELAEATKAYQTSTDGLSGIKRELESKVRIAESQVKATEMAKSDEFLDAAGNADIEATLTQMKR
jgi:phage shock protein A